MARFLKIVLYIAGAVVALILVIGIIVFDNG